jgi:hypothetical protein
MSEDREPEGYTGTIVAVATPGTENKLVYENGVLQEVRPVPTVVETA